MWCKIKFIKVIQISSTYMYCLISESLEYLNWKTIMRCLQRV
jgi:hypothetical protein